MHICLLPFSRPVKKLHSSVKAAVMVMSKTRDFRVHICFGVMCAMYWSIQVLYLYFNSKLQVWTLEAISSCDNRDRVIGLAISLVQNSASPWTFLWLTGFLHTPRVWSRYYKLRHLHYNVCLFSINREYH